MDGTSRHVALQTCLHFLQNRATVRVVAEPHDGEEHRLLEGTEVISHFDSAYIVVIMCCVSSDLLHLVFEDLSRDPSVW